jgi:hypothetical protein
VCRLPGGVSGTRLCRLGGTHPTCDRRKVREGWRCVVLQIYADLRKFVNPPALGVVQADFVHEKHPDIVGHVNRSIDGILR